VASGSIVGFFEKNQHAGGGNAAKNCGFGSTVHHWKLCGACGNALGTWHAPGVVTNRLFIFLIFSVT